MNAPAPQDGERRLGLAGRIAAAFLSSEITPLLALTGLLLGLFAILVTPREEEPQIAVTFANVFVSLPGADAHEVEHLITEPLEQVTSAIAGVEHVYSTSMPGQAMVTVRFEVGLARTEALVRLYNQLQSNMDWLPRNLGASMPLVKPLGIDDVPVFAATLWTEDPQLSGADLLRVANTLVPELKRVPGTRDIDVLGAPDRAIHVQFDPQRLAAHGLSLDDLRMALQAGNSAADAGTLTRDNADVQVRTGDFLRSAEDVANLIVGVRSGAPVYLREVAKISDGADVPDRYASFGIGPAGAAKDLSGHGRYPAVTLAIGKQPGRNAVEVTRAIEARLSALEGYSIPQQVHVTVTRDYGVTAQDKAQTLIKKLIFATLSVVVLVMLALGRREALVVGAAVIVTLALTLFASWAWGFTLNRVSLFALIFSIGILVDDAIVVVENIHRHMSRGGLSLSEAIPPAVDEVGGPTILATFTVIAALLPMAFVSGLMGPYMRPIPINASTGMLLSLAVAFMFTPWLYRRLFLHASEIGGHASTDPQDSALHRVFAWAMTPFLRGAQGNAHRWGLLGVLLLLIAASVSLAGFGAVILKMLPFDNKSEFQVLVDLPEGTPVDQTNAVLNALADHLDTVPEVTDYQIYAGASSPINFNGLVRQYALRSQSNQGDIQVNLLDKHDRSRKSHEIALAVRPALDAIARPYGASIKIVEVPPGPPVMAPLVAEVYGPSDAARDAAARRVRAAFEATDGIVDIDDSMEAAQPRELLVVDRGRAARLGVAQTDVAQAVATAFGGEDMSYLHDDQARRAVPIRVELTPAQKADPAVLQSLSVRARSGALVPLSELVQIRSSTRDAAIFHKDGLPVTYVTADVAGHSDSPLYGLAEIAGRLSDEPDPIAQRLISQPDVPGVASLKWDGEWQITYETFRDMGIAYSVGLVMIYLLVVAQFRSYGVPLIIMAPIPLTIIGIMPGHALLGQQFTAPSMIGMIALAGIIVRNSILLVDFIQLEVRAGRSLQEATIAAAAVRAKPIALTGLAAMLGGFFIIDDPIFGGLAVSLIFGILVSTVLTLLVIPVVYYATHWKQEAQH